MMGGNAKRLNNASMIVFLMLALMTGTASFSATPVINEVMPSNMLTVMDEDREYPDWIELYNTGQDPVDLGGYSLSDNPDNPHKWIFPHITIPPESHLLVFASGKDRHTYPAHWETVIAKGDIWHYFIGTSSPPDNWMERSFNDSGWLSGASTLGYGYDTVTTVVPKTLTLFVRKTFAVEDLSPITDAFLHIDYNDGFVAYLNGTEIARSNVAGSIGEHPSYNQRAIHTNPPRMAAGLPPEGYRIDDIHSLLVAGDNVLAIQVHNNNATSEDFLLDPSLTFGMDGIPATPHGVAEYLCFVPPHLHTNFKLDALGETLTLTDATGTLTDRFEYEIMPVDYSQGRAPDGDSNIVTFMAPTPDSANNTPGFDEYAGTATVAPAGGFYSDAITVTMSADPPDAEIRYTLNGNDPDQSSARYTGPISITTTRVLKTRVFINGALPGDITTRTYFINAEHSLPVISVSTPSKNLWDSEIGIYDSPNYWNEWERPAHIEFYETDGSMQFSEDAGIAIKGGLGSRYWPQKSLAIMFRNYYGVETVSCRLFPESDITEYSSFLLRNSGNDFDRTHFRDGMIQTLVKDVDIDQQNYRPAVVYLNGTYWGIQGIREKQNEDYLASHHNVDPDNLDILELNSIVVEGDADNYNSLIDYLESHDLSKQEHYEYVSQQIDINELISYYTIQIYCNNQDWPGNNIKFWRERTDEGRWRWLLFDLDVGFDLKASNSYSYNTLEHATALNGAAWQNPPWSTLLLRKLLENENFKQLFINRFMDYLSTIYSTDHVLSVINELEHDLEDEMPAHIATWDLPESMDEWHENIDIMRVFAQQRPKYVIQHLTEKFNTGDTALISIDVCDCAKGSVMVNSMTLDEYPWSGTYFTAVPVTVTAVPKDGYCFVRWEGDIEGNTGSLNIAGRKTVSLKAIFDVGISTSSHIVINEINYQSKSDFDAGDWVELYNNSEDTVDLSNWVLKDSQDDNVYTLKQGSSLPPEGYLVLCADIDQFRQRYPSVHNAQGDFGFGLNQFGDAIRLYDRYGTLVDSLIFNDHAPWPELNDEDARTISLTNPSLDNTCGNHWQASQQKGTPGELNDTYFAIDDDTGEEIREYALRQNYPNPFNQTTTITFELPKNSHVTIDLYSILGQKIKTLIQRDYPGGKHELLVSGSDLPSGIYLYKLSSGNFSKTKRLLLLK